MTIVLNGTTGITNDGGYTGDGVSFANTTPSNTLVTTTDGLVGIGTTSPISKLTVNGGVMLSGGAAASGGFFFPYYINATNFNAIGSDTNGGMTFITGVSAPAVRATIDNSGNLLVGTTSTSDFSVCAKMLSTGRVTSSMASGSSSDSTLHVYSTGAGAYRFYVNMAGTVFANSTTISAISDARFKENIRPLDAGLTEVMALQPRLYDWKEGKGADIKNARGFIAQEFETVFPDLIDEWKDPAPEGEAPYKSVRQDLIPVLVKAIQEQQAIITALTARVEALEGTQP